MTRIGLGLCAILILVVMGSSGCSGRGGTKDLIVPPIWHTPAEVDSAAEEHLKAAEAIRQQIARVRGDRTGESTLVSYNAILMELDQFVELAELTANVATDAAIREATDSAFQRGRQFVNKLRLDRGLCDALRSVKTLGLDAETRRFLMLTLRDYRRAGVDKDETTRQKLAALYEQIVGTEQEFDKNIREGRRYIELDSVKDLEGLPPDYVAAHPAGPDGKIQVSTDYSDYNPFLMYSTREDLRHALYMEFHRRAYPLNDRVLKQLLALRHEYATLLGYANWAEYAAEDKMVKNATAIAYFIDTVVGMARARSDSDVARLLARKRMDNPQATVVNDWDAAYYIQKIRQEQYGVSPQEVRSYFEFNRVKDGVLQLAGDLFGVVIKRVDGADVWDSSVEVYDVHDGGRLVGRVYLDLHPRKDKYSHVAVFPVRTGLEGEQVGVVTLVGNFPGPGTPEGPAFLEWQEVTTFLHEFGHVMHNMLSYKHRWLRVKGGVEWDFIEVPSQLLEEWGRDPGVLSRFAVHYRTGRPIPAELVARMNGANDFGRGVYVTRQLFYARLSLTYHNQDPAGINLLEHVKSLQAQYSPYPYEEGTYSYASFGHLQGYSSMYYTYMWSLALSRDIFTRFQASGLMDKKMAQAYRRAVLEPGGAKDASELVKDFLGRESSFDAFQKWLQE